MVTRFFSARGPSAPVLIAIPAFAILWAIALRDWLAGLPTRIAGDAGGDGALTAWQLLWPYEFLRQAGGGMPYLDGMFAGLTHGGAYTLSDMMPGWLPVVAFLRLFTENPILIVNLIHAGCLLLLPWSVYALARGFGAGRWEALAAGLLAAFTPYRFDMLYHLQMQPLFAPVFALYCQRTVLAKNKIRLARLAGWWLGLAWTLLVSPHLFLYGGLASFLLLWPLCRDVWRARHRITRRTAVGGGVLLFLTLAIIAAGASPYLKHGRMYALTRLKTESIYGALRLEDFAYAPERLAGATGAADGGGHEKSVRLHPIAVWLFWTAVLHLYFRKKNSGAFRRAVLWASGLAVLFWVATLKARLGLPAVVAADLLLLLALVPGVLRLRRRFGPARPMRGDFTLCVFAAFFFWLCAFGPRPVFHNVEIPWIAPYNLLYEFVPGFDRIRASARIVILFQVFFAPVAARGLGLLVRACAARRRVRRGPVFTRGSRVFAVALAFALAGWLWVDAWLPGFRPAGDFFAFDQIRKVYEINGDARSRPLWILSDAPGPDRTEAAALFYSIGASRILVGGITGVRVDPYHWLRAAYLDFLSGSADWRADELRALFPADLRTARLFYVRGDEILDRSDLLRPPVRPVASCPVELRGEWRFADVTRKRHALLVGFRPAGDFCVGPYGLFQDRALRLVWHETDGTAAFTATLRVSTPPYYHPAARELLFAAEGPGRRGRFDVSLFEGSREIYRAIVQVR